MPDIEVVADELYSLPREEFVAARDARAKEARSAGQRELATAIRALRKPTVAAWLVNLLAREHPDEIRGLGQLGEALREAHDALDGPALQQLSRQRHELVAALVRQARSLGRASAQPVSETVSRELTETFTAALTEPDAAEAVAAGRLTSGLSPGGGDGWPAIADASSRPVRVPRTEPAGGRAAPRSDRRDGGVDERGADERNRQQAERIEHARRDLEAAQRAATEADAARAEAERAAGHAEQRAEEAAGAVRELRERLDTAEHAELEADRRARSARRDHQAADRRARESEQRVRDLERRLAQLGAPSAPHVAEVDSRAPQP